MNTNEQRYIFMVSAGVFIGMYEEGRGYHWPHEIKALRTLVPGECVTFGTVTYYCHSNNVLTAEDQRNMKEIA